MIRRLGVTYLCATTLAALRTRLLMCKHRGDYPNTTVAVSAARSPSRFERLPPARARAARARRRDVTAAAPRVRAVHPR